MRGNSFPNRHIISPKKLQKDDIELTFGFTVAAYVWFHRVMSFAYICNVSSNSIKNHTGENGFDLWQNSAKSMLMHVAS